MPNIKAVIDRQRAFFETGATKQTEFRLEQLRKLKTAIKAYESSIMEALKLDLNKNEFESFASEIGILLEELSLAQKQLPKWTKPKKVKTPSTHLGASSYRYPEPYGRALIIAPWNYPFQLAIAPLIGAMAAGNCAVLKPSELAPHTSGIIARVISETFDPGYITVVEGTLETSQALLAEPFDCIFFTGSVAVGKSVMEAASKHLTPVTLELGGKSPCIVHDDADLKKAAKRIIWGKLLNAGQTCVAPDYLYAHASIKEPLINEMKKQIRKLFGQPFDSPEQFPRIINERHFDRIINLMSSGQTIEGGRYDRERLIIEPTLLDQVTWEDPIMKEEIFGPVLPILTYTDLSEVIRSVSARPKPLALYAFTTSNLIQERLIDSVPFGGGCMNDTIMHIVNPHLPFGGTGNSGMGSYHGKSSFDQFSHYKSVLKQTNRFDLPFRYPNRRNGLKLLKMVFK
ncbi:aldehyde dehydrogenase [Paenibacillus larvae]|uniref:aldehyde dehydrogenase n=1 Tax=Paenibacillus larvae TaxID=1464 RepID=UPI00227F62D9|nr:aldehyde dehydrogenase [Paenibacillus larvae]MCY9510732.1 aldehyde dehydrogenase [Paenibacillus larvae]MCY9524064.1 aldehyde dehydrogenase [Paenibacillus larvae]